MDIIPTLTMGIGIPVVSQWISGGLNSFKKEATLQNVALSSVAGIAIAAIAYQMMQPAPAVVAAGVPCPSKKMSVSGVTVQLGRYAGGIDYPGQLRGVQGATAQFTDGNLIFVD